MKNKILAIMVEDLPWMYYGKYRQYLNDMGHPFKETIDFVVDLEMTLSSDFIRQYPVVIFYFRDPLKHLYPDVYQYAKKIQKICNDSGIRLVNDPDALSLSAKSDQLKILSDNGYLVAKSFKFENVSDLSKIELALYPLFIRNNAGHDSDNLTMQGPFSSYSDILQNYKDKPLSNKKHLDGNVAIQWIDTKSSKDSLYRRYRAFATSIDAITGNLYISADWYIHGANNVSDLSAQHENESFIYKEYTKNEKDFFIGVNNVLGLKFSAIDYAYTRDGKIVIWEVNPHPAFPAWVDKEPSRSKNTELLSNLYKSVLDED